MAKDSLVKASTPEPFSRSRTSNWVARGGGLPPYVQHVAHDLMEKRGMDESKAIQVAIGVIKNWAAGEGKVDANTRAAAQKALAEWEKLKASNAAKKVAESTVADLDAWEPGDDDKALMETVEPPKPPARALRPRARRRPVPAGPDDPLSMHVELGDLSLLETAANPGVTRWGHPVTKTSFPGQHVAQPAPRKPRRTRTGQSSEYDASKHPRGRGGEWTVKQGSTGDVVRVIQRRVGAKADGAYGSQTRQSVMDFQRRHGLKVDGVVGRQTIAAMRGDANAVHVNPGGATRADRRWLAGRAAMRKIREANLSAADRKKLDKSDFAIPEKAPGSGSYPIHDLGHAKAALSLCSGKPEAGRVKAAVYRRYPQLKKGVQEAALPGPLATLRFDGDLRLIEAPSLEIHEQQPLALVETAVSETGGHGASTALDLSLIEATNGEVQFNADGSVDFALIRPCLGRGVGSRIYTADMLRENAHVPAGLVMYDSHESPAAKRARQGLPRPPSELCGQVLESWWDPSFRTPTDDEYGYGPGAIIGRCMLTEDAEKLVKRLPRAVKVSVNMEASGLRPSSMGGKRGMLVEGLVGDPDRHSIDLVTTAGAGGAVASLFRDMMPA